MTTDLRPPPPDADVPLTETDFARIARIARAGWGLSLDSAKRPLIRSRLGRRLKALGLSGFDPYCELVESGDAVECDHFITALTTNVSHFYREVHHFDLLETTVLPDLIARARRGQRVRLWSAGCSTGQEPFSLAASILALARDAADLDLRILASDVDPSVLKTAEAGAYDGRLLSFPSPAYEARLFAAPPGTTRDLRVIRPELKSLITYRRLNLVADWPFSGRFDVILCRNVAIYFDKATQVRLWTRFSEALQPGGLLLIGHSERIAAPADHGLAVAGITAYRSFRDALGRARRAEIAQEQARDVQQRVVDDLGRGLRALASGELDTRLNDAYGAEYDQLRADFNETVGTMESLMRSIAANATEIRARAEEISASSDDLSHRTENQAATLEETAAALDQLTASVRAAAESASEVEKVVADARKEAEKSGQVVSEAVAAMSLIRKSSNEISQIIGVIDDIAFQTNLLALNAGVEAARAGDAGRGFAVVASEVRALAQRSSEAAKQIKTLITGSSEQVETGVGLVGRAGETLGMIIDRVGNINDLVGGIATGAREQSSGLGEINVGVSQLDQVTQQNAAMVEEVTAASVTLRTEASALNQVVSRFRLGEDPHAAPAEIITLPAPALKPPVAESGEAQPRPAIAANLAKWQDF